MVYDRIEEIPYDLLKRGGTFEVYSLPGEMMAPGYGMGAINSEAYQNNALMNPDGAPEERGIWATILVAHSGLILGTICVSVVAVLTIYAIKTIKAVPQGEVKDILPNGDRVYQTADGATWLLHGDGTIEKIGDAPASLTTTILAAVGLVIVVTIIYIVIKMWPKGEKVKST